MDKYYLINSNLKQCLLEFCKILYSIPFNKSKHETWTSFCQIYINSIRATLGVVLQLTAVVACSCVLLLFECGACVVQRVVLRSAAVRVWCCVVQRVVLCGTARGAVWCSAWCCVVQRLVLCGTARGAVWYSAWCCSCWIRMDTQFSIKQTTMCCRQWNNIKRSSSIVPQGYAICVSSSNVPPIYNTYIWYKLRNSGLNSIMLCQWCSNPSRKKRWRGHTDATKWFT